ncbi:MAG: sulfide/dihydroorotate dehydrogenase-like FAD/NAD-binding protein [Candidatus Saccharicenans sp.]|nr:sulfide/dihydroorotate dehydrogenase-like FAD/NAD-binding protein [Candidatus Saccharicenans sp.]
MNRVLVSERLVPNVYRLVLEAPEVAVSARAGQFLMVIPDSRGERIPLNVADWDRERGTVEVVFLNLGASTRKLASLREGDLVEGVAGPLGRSPDLPVSGTVLLVGGCYGIGGLYPLARELKERGNRVIFLAEARSPAFLYWVERIKRYSDGFVEFFRQDCLEAGEELGGLMARIKREQAEISAILVIGCSYLLFRISEAGARLGLKTMVNLNPIMVDGTGMCGACRVSVGGRTFFACVDGPWFDGRELDWVEYFDRRKAFLREEEKALARVESEFWIKRGERR